MRAREESIDIQAEPDVVFDLIHDYSRRLDWDPFLREARLLGGVSGAGVGPGQTRVTYRFNLSARPRWLRSLLDPILFAVFARETRLRLSALKSFLERANAR
jgi:hypothetical protein